MPFPGVAGKPALDDCAITAMNVYVQARRTSAMVDVGLRVHGVKGGACRILPAAVLITTGKGGAVGRPMSLRFVDGQVQRPINLTEGAGGEQLSPWVGLLRPADEKQVVLRYYVEGLDQGDGAVDPAGRLSVQIKNLGARVYAGAPLNVKVQVDASSKATVKLATGNPKAPIAPRSTGPDGSASLSSALSKDDLLPQIEWRYDGDLPPAAESDKLSGGLAVFEYLRGGLVQEFATVLGTVEKKDDKDKKDKKDEKKDDKKDKKDDKVALAWDKALDVSFAAAKSNDPVVAGMGLRLFAWLASGLAAAPVKVHAAGGTAAPDSTEVPEKLASQLSKVSDGFLAATGQRMAPSVGSSPFVKASLGKLGEPGSHKKDADEAIKRLVARLDDGKAAPAVGNFFSTAPTIALAPGVKLPGARLITWNKQGNAQFVSSGHESTPKAPLARRVVHALSHPIELVKFFLVLGLIASVVFGIRWAMRGTGPEPVKALSRSSPGGASGAGSLS